LALASVEPSLVEPSLAPGDPPGAPAPARERPGAVRPGAVAGPAATATPASAEAARPGAVRPGVAAGVAAPTAAELAARPGAVRPGAAAGPAAAGPAAAPGPAAPPVSVVAVGQGPLAPPAPPEGTPEAAGAEKIPEVPDRPLNVDQGQRIKVDRFELVGAVDRAEAGIQVAEIEKLLEDKRQERKEGFSIGRLQEVADSVTKYYRDRGLILAQAFIPVQQVVGGRIKIEVMEGKLGRVVAEGNKVFSSDLLTAPFEQLIGKPVTRESSEGALLNLVDYAGLNAFGVFQPGQQVGTSDLVVKAQKEREVDGSVRWDNHGLPATGRNKTRVDMGINDLTGAGDRIQATAMETHVPTNTFYWNAQYQRPIFAPGYLFRARVDRNQFKVAPAAIGTVDPITGQKGEIDTHTSSDTRNVHLDLSKALLRSRQRNISVELDVDRRRAVTSQLNGYQDHPPPGGLVRKINSVDNIFTATTILDIDSVDSKWSGLNTGTVHFTHGFNNLFGAMGPGLNKTLDSNNPNIALGKVSSRVDAHGNYASGEFNKYFSSYTRLQSLAPLHKALKNHNLLFRMEGQFSPDLLVPMEQYSVGGPNNVRAYGPTEGLFDRAYFYSLEWLINAPGISDLPAYGNKTWGQLVQLSMFYDSATGWRNHPIPHQDIHSRNYNGAGASISFNDSGFLTSKVSVAYPVGMPEPKDGHRPQIWFDVTYYY
jgi:hemolysin activation/secretion protein